MRGKYAKRRENARVTDRHGDDCVSNREFDGHVGQANERYKGLVMAVEEMKEKNDETRSQLKDIKYLLLVLIMATAPQIVNFVMTMQGGHH